MRAWGIGPGRLVIRQGDLTQAETDAVVTAANSRLAGGGGVDGAVHRAAGPQLLEVCRAVVAERGEIPAGQAALTPGFALAAKWVVHAVGPIWKGGVAGEDAALTGAYLSSLELAKGCGARSIAFPAISCGAYGYPLPKAMPVALGALAQGLARGLVGRAELWLFGAEAYQAWCACADELFGPGFEAGA